MRWPFEPVLLTHEHVTRYGIARTKGPACDQRRAVARARVCGVSPLDECRVEKERLPWDAGGGCAARETAACAPQHSETGIVCKLHIPPRVTTPTPSLFLIVRGRDQHVNHCVGSACVYAALIRTLSPQRERVLRVGNICKIETVFGRVDVRMI